MAHSGKLTATELSAYYEASGSQGIRSYFGNEPVLVVYPEEASREAITWTPHRPTRSVPRTPASDLWRIDEIMQIAPELPRGAVVSPIVLNPQGQCTIGRSLSSFVKLTSETVSRTHARLRKPLEDGGADWLLEDLDSQNGTFVDGIKLVPYAPYNITPYKEVRFGAVRATFLDMEALVELCRVVALA